jgi:hypothetical protein
MLEQKKRGREGQQHAIGQLCGKEKRRRPDVYCGWERRKRVRVFFRSEISVFYTARARIWAAHLAGRPGSVRGGELARHGLDARPRPRLWPWRAAFSLTVAMRASWTKRGWAASECGWARAPLPRPGRMGRSVVGLNGRPGHLVSHIFPAIIFFNSWN